MTHPKVVLVAFVTLVSACEADRPQPIGGTDTLVTEPEPLVGGSCTYDDVAFRGTVDSVLTERGLLSVEALDSVAAAADLCGSVTEGGEIRWIVRPPALGPEVGPGDTLEVVGQVIATGTCTPCSLSSRRVQER